jgi:ABC-type transport system involved in cytochrome bd biosynthesis fused ATPase/permease subunit
MSALDQMTKDNIVANILVEYRNKIVIFVSHDISIREKVDIVIELHKYADLSAGQQATIHESILQTS